MPAAGSSSSSKDGVGGQRPDNLQTALGAVGQGTCLVRPPDPPCRNRLSSSSARSWATFSSFQKLGRRKMPLTMV